MSRALSFTAVLVVIATIASSVSSAQDRETSTAVRQSKDPVVFTTARDRQNMLDQLGIKKLRPGRDSNPNSPNTANYDQAKANPYPKLPAILETKGGTKVTTPEQWWRDRRPEIVEMLEREVYGRIPATVPKVKWEVRETREIEAGGRPAIRRHIVGVVDNSECPGIAVNISMSLTLPKESAGPVPVLMSFGWTPFEPSPFNFRPRNGAPAPPSKEDLLVKAGWGCATLNPTTVQDDAGGWQPRRFGPGADPNAKPTDAGLTRGIIKYSAEDSSFGRRTTDDLPVDSHMTLALCAPRLTFISHGIPERGDAHWLDHQGSFMATIAAQPVFRLLGARDLGRSDDYMSERMPAVNVDLLDGALGWRQHDGGHTDLPNVEHFIRWAETKWGKGKQPAVSATPEPDRRSLKDAVGDRFKIGVGVSFRVVQQPDDAALIRQHFQILTPENCMKPQSIHPAENRWNFEAADRFAEFARANKLEMVGHCLVWAKDDRTDEWMKRENGQPVSRETLLRRIKNHIDTVVERYADVATQWDVVNEAIGDGNEGLLRDSVYSRTAGIDFIVTAFKAARDKDPDALLIYNDYNGHKPGKREKLIELLSQLKQKGAPVDAYGMQGHFELGDNSIPQLRETFDQLRKLGIKIVVSELDIDVVTRGRWWAEKGKHRDELAKYDPYKNGLPEEIEQKQIKQYVALFQLFDEYSDLIERVSFWNLHDGQSWLDYFPWNRVNYPLLFDRNRRPKPAFDAVYAMLRAPRSVHAPLERRDPNSRVAHQQLIAKTKRGKIDIYFEGDSITRRWGATDYPDLLENWKKHFRGWNAANFGWGGDTTHNILWRLQNGELDGVSPKVIVLQAGTNNLPWAGPADAAAIADVVVGIKAIIATFQKKAPGAAIVLTALFPRPQNKALAPTIERINDQLATLADGKTIRFLNINKGLTDDSGDLLPGISRDGLHLEEKGYDVWAAALKPIFAELLGPRAESDQAPPPTGDPSKARSSAAGARP